MTGTATSSTVHYRTDIMEAIKVSKGSKPYEYTGHSCTIITGKKADDALTQILANEKDGTYPHMKGTCGYYHDQTFDKWIAFDNTTCDCWVEEFRTKDECLDWINELYDTTTRGGADRPIKTDKTWK